MIAKVIAHGRDRGEALSRLAGALGDTVVIGPHANAAFLKALVSHPEFRGGRFDTGFIDRNLGELTHVDPAAENGAIAAAVETLLRPAAQENDGVARSVERAMTASRSGRHESSISTSRSTGTRARRPPNGATGRRSRWTGSLRQTACASCRRAAASPWSRTGLQRSVALKSYDSIDVDHLDGDGVIKAPMHGKVLAILVEQGATVSKGERVAVVEAMKMEHALMAPIDGTVGEIVASVGAQIAEGATILSIAAPLSD